MSCTVWLQIPLWLNCAPHEFNLCVILKMGCSVLGEPVSNPLRVHRGPKSSVRTEKVSRCRDANESREDRGGEWKLDFQVRLEVTIKDLRHIRLGLHYMVQVAQIWYLSANWCSSKHDCVQEKEAHKMDTDGLDSCCFHRSWMNRITTNASVASQIHWNSLKMWVVQH